MSKNEALSLRAQWLGDRLRTARNAAGYKLADVGEYLGLAVPTLSRFEAGAIRIRKSYVRDLIDFYAVRPHERAMLLQLIEDSWRRDWWDGDISDLEKGFIDYTWLESRAAEIQTYESTLIHGLLQTVPYARAIAEAGSPEADEAAIDRLVELRVSRQRILGGDDPAKISLIIEADALHRPIGGTEVQRGQLLHLLERSSEPHIDVRVILPSVGWHPGTTGPFILFLMRDPYPDVVYLEGAMSRTFLEDEAKVDRYGSMYGELRRLALPADRSHAYIESIVKEL